MKRFRLITGAASLASLLILIQSLGLNHGHAGNSRNSGTPRAGQSTSIHVQNKSNSWIGLRDGHDLFTRNIGVELARPEDLQSTPLALAAGDFDEDGVPDLLTSYSSGRLTLHRGNLDSIYPNSPAADERKAAGIFSDEPFLLAEQTLYSPEVPSFIGAGDFDADGHLDIVIVTRGGHWLTWMAGNGQGGFGTSNRIELPGPATAMLAGEMNRADGLADLIVGIADSSDSQLLVFEGPEGALKHAPESIALAAPATLLALGQLDDDYERDLAVAAGGELVIVHGRDRCLSLDSKLREAVLPARFERRQISFPIAALSIGDFSGDYQSELAVASFDGDVQLLSREAHTTQWNSVGQVPAEVASRTTAANEGSSTPELPPMLIRVRVSGTGRDDLLMIDRNTNQLQIISVDSASQESVAGAKITENPRLEVSALLAVEGEPLAVLPMRLNADALSDLIIAKRGGNAPLAVTLTAASSVITVNTSAINNTRDSVLSISEAIAVANGDLAKSALTQAEQAQVNGTPTKPGLDEIRFSGVTSISPTATLNFSDAITIDGGASRVEIKNVGLSLGQNAPNSTIRSLVLNQTNFGGGMIRFDANAGGNIFVEGNYIGTNSAGDNAAWGNTSTDGIVINDSPNIMIGGTAVAARNVISAGGLAIRIGANSPGNKIQGNYIGTDAAGSKALGGGGIRVEAGFSGTSPNQQFGGTEAGAGNLISATNGLLTTNVTGLLIQGNLIGTDALGATAITASGGLAQLDLSNTAPASGITVGGTTPAARNIISSLSTTVSGIRIAASAALVQGNHIGTNKAGTTALGNGTGVSLVTGGTGSTVGGTTAAARNIISGNNTGVVLNSANNLAQGNYIGTDITGTADLGNKVIGVSSSAGNTVGGTDAGAGNVIAFNKGNGVSITGTALRRNSIFGNTQAGISSNANAPTLNGITGTLQNSTPNTTFTIEFFSNPTCGANGFEQGKTYIGETTATTNGSGVSPAFNVPGGQNLTATASAPGLNTSRFSNCIAGVATPANISLNPNQLNFTSEVGTNPQSQTVTLTNTGTSSLNWQANSLVFGSATWLSINPPTSGVLAGNTSTTLTITVNSLSLLSDTYTGRITVSSANAPNSPQTVDVTHVVTCPPAAAACTDILNLENIMPASGTLLSENDLKNNGLRAKVNYLLQSKKQADLVLRVFDQNGNRVGSSEVKSINRPDPAPNPIPGEVFVIPGSAVSLFPDSTSLSMQAILINPLNSEVIKWSEPPAAFPLAKDSDGDGLFDSWETNGIDFNNDGTIDLDLSKAPYNAKPDHKDLFVEIDYMEAAHSHRPGDAFLEGSALAQVEAAFAAAPVTNPDGVNGIRLHTYVDDKLPEVNPLIFSTAGPGPADDFQDLKSGVPNNPCDGNFGTVNDRSSPNCANILAARRLVFRYCIFGHGYSEKPGSSGRGEVPGNDFMVSLGRGFQQSARDAAGNWGTTYDKEWEDLQAGTFMHEFGHTLGLRHGGADDMHHKPNYLSIMSYSRQFNNAGFRADADGFATADRIRLDRRLDYSRSLLPALNENSLNENNGVGDTGFERTLFGMSNGLQRFTMVGFISGPLDFNNNGRLEASVAVDVRNR